jgi:uncharacterized phage protein gp47/JayE
MSPTTPTTKEISDNIIAQLQTTLNQTIPLLPKAFNRVLAKALAAIFTILYKYGGFIFLQMFVQTASTKETEINGAALTPLIEWGRLIGVGDPVPATQAELLVEVTVEVQTGSLPASTQLVNSGNGVTYLTIGSVLLDAPTVQATIRAVSDQSDGGGAGAIGNLDPGAIVSFANTPANVANNTTVLSQVVTGADAEDLGTVYRQRVLDRFQKRLQGGAYSDYEIWGEEVAGILNVYPYTSDCPGQVDVYVEATVESSGDPDGIPTTAQLEAVLASIDFDLDGLASRRPANALANTFPITRTGFDTRVIGLLVDDLAQVEADITTGIEEYFLSREPFIVGLSVLPRKDRITETAVGGVVDDIVSAAGGVFTEVIVTQAAVDVTLYNLGIGEKSKSSSVAFV